jgi:hypothetical protein
MDVRLSTKGLENVASLGIQDFTLRIGEQAVLCSRFEASFLSPRITAALLNDATLTEFELELDAFRMIESNSLSDLLSLSHNRALNISTANFESIKSLAKSLGNRGLCRELLTFARGTEELSLSNVDERLALAESLEVSGSAEVDYLAAHFYEVDIDVLRLASRDCLEAVLGSEQLRISTEDSLLEVIFGLGDDYLSLVGHARTEWLSASGIERLLNRISIEDLDGRLWSSLCSRLRLFVRPLSVPQSRFHGKQVQFQSSLPLDGILASLTRQFGGNVHTKEIVEIKASSTQYHQCQQVADYAWTSYWHSRNMINSWIQFDFKDRRISVAHYSIKSDGEGNSHLAKWSLAGSEDAESWTVLDERDTQDLDGSYVVKTYECQSHRSSCFRFIRLTQTRLNSSKNQHLMLANVEFFGGVCYFPRQ